MKEPRLFIKVDPEWRARLERYCEANGVTISGAIRAALEEPMRNFERGKGREYLIDWAIMTPDRKCEIIAEYEGDFSEVAKDFNTTHAAVQRFAYRNRLVGNSTQEATQ